MAITSAIVAIIRLMIFSSIMQIKLPKIKKMLHNPQKEVVYGFLKEL
jgi:hypothetical protein